LLLLAVPRAALAWEASSDASGTIEIRDGGKAMASFSPKTPKERRGQPIVRHVLVNGHRILEVRTPILAEGPKREEVWVAELPGKNVIWWDEARGVSNCRPPVSLRRRARAVVPAGLGFRRPSFQSRAPCPAADRTFYHQGPPG
jgi:hypothetical protein